MDCNAVVKKPEVAAAALRLFSRQRSTFGSSKVIIPIFKAIKKRAINVKVTLTENINTTVTIATTSDVEKCGKDPVSKKES